MPAILETRTADNVIQLTDTETFFRFKSKSLMGSGDWVSLASYWGGLFEKSLVITAPAGSNLMVAFRPPSGGYYWAYLYLKSGNTYTYKVRGGQTLELAAAIEYFVFDTSPPPSTSPGIELYNSAGVRVYNSNHAIAKVLGRSTSGTSNPGYIGTEINGKKTAFVPQKSVNGYTEYWMPTNVECSGGMWYRPETVYRFTATTVNSDGSPGYSNVGETVVTGSVKCYLFPPYFSRTRNSGIASTLDLDVTGL